MFDLAQNTAHYFCALAHDREPMTIAAALGLLWLHSNAVIVDY